MKPKSYDGMKVWKRRVKGTQSRKRMLESLLFGVRLIIIRNVLEDCVNQALGFDAPK